MPKVSIVCSVYNAARFLDSFLNSIAHQDLTDFEAILVDAASIDGTRERLQAYSQKDSRFKLIKEEFISIAKAVNIGLREAQGEYIARVDADNLLFPDFLSSQVNFLDEHPDVDFVYADQLKIDDRNKILGINPSLISDYAIKKHLLFKTAFGGAPMLGRKQAFFDVGLYEETTIITEDRIFALKARNKKCAGLNHINYAYRIHGGAITSRYKKTADHQAKVQEYERKYIDIADYYNDLARYRDILEADLLYKPLILQKIATTVLYCGLRLADLGRREDGIKEIEKAIMILPKNALLYRFFIWRIKQGARYLEKLAAKVNYWLPYSVDFLQLVPVKIWKKALKTAVDKKVFQDTISRFNKKLI
jgi:glycosyltransferase involved in cell wall biosynthesis